MSIKIRYRLIIAIAFIMAISVGGFAACNKDQPPEGIITLNKTELNLERYEMFILTASTENLDGFVVWSSGNSQVVTVEGGKISSVGVGVSVVTASVGGVTAQCTVTVTDNGLLPDIVIDNATIALFNGGQEDIGTRLVFLSQVYDDAVFSYESLNTNIATVSSSGIVTAQSLGTTEITVSASWRNVPAIYLTKSVTVIVNENMSVTANQSGFTLYVTESVDGTAFEKSVAATATVVSNGNEVSQPELLWESDTPSVAVIDGASGIITAQSEGSAKIRAAYTSQSGFTATTNWVTVDVIIPFVTKSFTGLETDRTTSGLPSVFKGLFLNKDIVKIEDVTDLANSINLNYSGGQIDKGKLIVGERKWKVLNECYGYIVDVTVASKIITDRNQLKLMYTDYLVTQTSGHYEGYIILKADLDFSGYNYSNSMWDVSGFSFSSYDKSVTDWNSNWSETKTLGFDGVFDGRGHTISNITMCSYGLFPAITEGSVFKNTSFVNVTFNKGEATTVAAVIHGMVDNVSVMVTNYEKWGNAGAISIRTLGTGTVSNSMVYLADVSAANVGAISRTSGEGCTVNNVYAISNIDAFTSDRNFANISNNGIIFSTVQAFINERNKVTGSTVNLIEFKDSIWDKTSDIPLFKNHTAGLSITADFTDLVAGDFVQANVNSPFASLILNADSPYNSYITLSASGLLEISYELNNVVSVNSITFSVSSALFGSQTVKTLVFTFTKVIKAQENLSGILFDFDKSEMSEYVVPLSDDYNNISSDNRLRIGSYSVSFSVDTSNGVKIRIPYSQLSGIPTGDYILLLETDNTVYRQAVTVVTKIIRTNTEFTQLYTYLKTATVGRYEGYILLGANLDFNGIVYNNQPWNVAGFCVLTYDADMAALAESNWNSMDTVLGMLGTIDGRGYTIKNLTLRTYGLFTKLAPSGVVKNIAFVDTIFSGDDATTICKYNAGIIDNVFVTVKTPPASNKQRSGALCTRLVSGGTIKNSIAYYTGIGGAHATIAAVAQIAEEGSTFSNVYAISDRGAFATNNSGLSASGIVYANVDAFYSERQKTTGSYVNLSEFNALYWDFTYKLPIFKGYSGSIVII